MASNNPGEFKTAWGNFVVLENTEGKNTEWKRELLQLLCKTAWQKHTM